jgi:hypothetical protein
VPALIFPSMHRLRILPVWLAAIVAATALDSVRPAQSAPIDLVARAAGQELTAERVADLVAHSEIPLTASNIGAAVDLWISYQLLGYAGARGDAIARDTQFVDAHMWQDIITMRGRRFYEVVRTRFPAPDTTNLEAKYAQAESFAAQHILILMPQDGAGMSDQKQDSLRRVALDIRARVTSANFSAMAKEHTQDPGSKETGGTYAMFPAGQMSEAFEKAVRAAKPGEIAPGLVKTEHGFHIIRRHLLSEVRNEFIASLSQADEAVHAAAYLAKLRADYGLAFLPGAAAKIKLVATSTAPDATRRDTTVIATTRLGPFTAGRLAKWIEVIPTQNNLPALLATAPDSTILRLTAQVITQELIGAEAAKSGVQLTADELRQIREGFATMVSIASQNLRIDAVSLADSARTPVARERLAAVRADRAIDELFKTNGQSFVEITPSLAAALRAKYPSRVNNDALAPALLRAAAIRAATDSLKIKKD